jgi:site-specific recombinase XerD
MSAEESSRATAFSPKEFADRSGLSLATVHRYLKSGRLKKRQPGGKSCRVFIPESELDSPGRPISDARTDQASLVTPSEEAATVEPLPGRRPAWIDGLHPPQKTQEATMPQNSNPEQFQCQFFLWPIYQRKNGVWYADDRSNGAGIKRTSLGTKNKQEAIANLHQLDRVQAENLGLTPRSSSRPGVKKLSIKLGRKLFDDHTSRPRIVGGAKASTQKRYKAILDKFEPFLESKRVTDWNQITERTLSDYASHLTENEYAYKTIFGELNTIKTAFKCLCTEGHLDREPLRLPLRKAECQRAYCYTEAEVTAMIQRCTSSTDLEWLRGVIIALSCTGLRISELASLKWPDIRFDDRALMIADESGFVDQKADRRSTKSSRSRHIPIHKGIPERIVMEWLGHSDSEMVKIYYHLSDEESRRKMDQLDLLGDGDGCSDVGDK